MSTAFDITEIDIETVLRQNAAFVVSSGGTTFAVMAEHIFTDWIGGINFDRIAMAAMASGTSITAQIVDAYAEIRLILVDEGVLKN